MELARARPLEFCAIPTHGLVQKFEASVSARDLQTNHALSNLDRHFQVTSLSD